MNQLAQKYAVAVGNFSTLSISDQARFMKEYRYHENDIYEITKIDSVPRKSFCINMARFMLTVQYPTDDVDQIICDFQYVAGSTISEAKIAAHNTIDWENKIF